MSSMFGAMIISHRLLKKINLHKQDLFSCKLVVSNVLSVTAIFFIADM